MNKCFNSHPAPLFRDFPFIAENGKRSAIENLTRETDSGENKV
jgi:hypothetical protein